jgi:hypothetical protein
MYIVGIGALIAAFVCYVYLRPAKQAEDILYCGSDHVFAGLLEFLTEADEAYIRTHETSEIQYFSKFAAHSACHEVMETIFKKPPLLFGVKKHRRRTWTVLEEGEEGILLRKELTHIPVKIKRGLRMPLGDRLIETWRVSFQESGFLVEEVY